MRLRLWWLAHRRAVQAAVRAVWAFVVAHALVVLGVGFLAVAAALVSVSFGWAVAGLGCLFLQLRREPRRDRS